MCRNFRTILRNGRLLPKIPADLQEFMKCGSNRGEIPADLQEFTCVVEWDGWSERLTSGLGACGEI